MMAGSTTVVLTTGGFIVAYLRLGHVEREVIMCLLGSDPDVSWSEIGRQVGFHRSTIQREVTRNGGRNTYSARRGHRRCRLEAAKRSRFRFDTDPDLAAEVVRLLVAGYSPYAVAVKTGAVCAETIYQAIYSGRLNLDPNEILRTRRGRRRRRHLRQPYNDGNYLGNFTPILDRPDHINRRLRVGDWEGDLITGTKNQSAIITLTERRSRYQVALKLAHGHSADATILRLHQWINSHQPPICSLTWDRGAELARWTQLENQHGIAVYFTAPKSPWQKASVENANRQLRFWFPPKTNLSIYTQTDLDSACHILNTTPRRLHNGATAHNIYHQHPRTKE
jgi:IS30 family transposase